ncbi:hypothetical protein FE840_011875 [Peteryoungia desertarenae]|uniref:Uncharacterized protein n=1 Tax=Peteryoungia desertarenae TaxID=1813451 RepID=A0ABX6QPV2_9HYPH|nr:hypothetical protein [Peteryoungia desertarenae]QLF70180.1 hypothetical protein FE840_011875 [Peteryoungia desertarenae]
MTTIRTPPDWHDHDFRLQQISKFAGMPATTVDGWLATARAQGHAPGVMAGRFRWLSAYHVFAVALLAKLGATGFPITPTAIFSAFDFAASDAPGDYWTVADHDGAKVTVDAWLAFAAVKYWAERERARNDRNS